MALEWQVFLQDDGSGRTYGAWMIDAWGWTLSVAACAWCVAMVVGTALGVVRTLEGRPMCVRLGNAWVELFRNIPLLVQMFLWYFVFPELLPQAWGDAIKQMPPPWSSLVPAVLCLGLFMSVRVAEQVRSGIQALPKGQRMAGLAVGLTTWQTYRYVLLPVVFRIILPPLTSEFLNTIKNTSLALTIGLMELTGRARAMQEFSFHVFEAFAAATVIYLLVNLCVVLAMRRLENHLRLPGYIGSASNAPQAGH